MLKMRYILLLLCVITVVVACDNEQRNGKLPIITGYTDEALANGANLGIESFEIVPLETTEASLLSNIVTINLIDSIVIIQSQEKLLCFNRSGKFNCAYGVKGRGPGEYLQIDAFFVNKKARTVTIIDNGSNKKLTYSLEGKYLSTEKYLSSTFHMIYLGVLVDDDNLLRVNRIYNDFNTVYSIFNLDNEKQQPLYDFPVKTQKTGELIGKNPVSFYKDTVKAIVPFDNKIYAMTDLEFRPINVIKTAQSLVSQKQLEAVDDFSIMTYMNFMDQGNFKGFTGISETKNHILLNFFESEYFLIDKRKNIGVLYRYSVDDEVNTLPLLNISTASSECFIGIYNVSKLKEIADIIPVNSKDRHLQEIKKVLDSLSYNDNPCLLFYTLK